MPIAPKTLLITGVNSGFGLALAKAALHDGHRVVGTVRNEAALAAFEGRQPGRAFGRLLEVTDLQAIQPLVDGIEADIGPIDVLVNNAGYGHEGTLEESSLDDVLKQFAVNVFGPVALMKAILPHMRKRRAGHIVNITSMAGMNTSPGISVYHGSKFALEGISESVGKEVKHLGIAVTAVAPGSFRTDWAGRSMGRTARTISDYDEVIGPLLESRRKRNGAQPGDPAKAARAILAIVETEGPPAHLLLGKDALERVRGRMDTLSKEIDAWEYLSKTTDFDERDDNLTSGSVIGSLVPRRHITQGSLTDPWFGASWQMVGRPNGSLRTVSGADLPQDGFDVNLDRRFCHIELTSDDFVGSSLHQASEDFRFPDRELSSARVQRPHFRHP